MPLLSGRRGRTCLCVALPLVLGVMLFLSSFPVQGRSGSGEGGDRYTWSLDSLGLGEGKLGGGQWWGAIVGRPGGGEGSMPTPTSLWSYIPSLPSLTDLDAPAGDIWSFLAAHKGAGRRASWGALSNIGASAYLRDNLRADMKYFTAFPIAGFNNQVIDIMNTIYLAIAAHRTPILASFKPDINHLFGSALPLAVGDVFDLSLLSSTLQQPVVEVHELRIEEYRAQEHLRYATYDGETGLSAVSRNGTDLNVGDRVRNEQAQGDVLGCWSAEMVSGGMAGTWGGFDPVKISWTPVPPTIFPTIGSGSEPEYDRWSLPALVDVLNTQAGTLPPSSAARLAEKGWPTPERLPDDQLACMQTAYWLVEDAENEDLHGEWRAGKGTWDKVGRHMRFQPGLVRIADDYLRDLWGLGWEEEVPSYMAIHMRRGDFDPIWKNITPRQWAYRARQAMDQAKAEMGIEVSRILVTTDETDEGYLAPFRKMGWTFADHTKTRTAARLGFWFPTLIDGVLLAQAKVFMGIPSSTMSILARRRVEDWYDGFGAWAEPQIDVPAEWTWSW